MTNTQPRVTRVEFGTDAPIQAIEWDAERPIDYATVVAWVRRFNSRYVEPPQVTLHDMPRIDYGGEQ